MACPIDWPEPIVRVQSLSNSGQSKIDDRYIKPQSERADVAIDYGLNDINIPLVDFEGLFGDCADQKSKIFKQVSDACHEWGFFQVINHGVSPQLMDRAKGVWKDFFHLPMEKKEMHANSPKTYEGYGSRVGVRKGAILDWCDYYFLYYLPCSLKDHEKWPAQPENLREVIEEYSRELVKLGGTILKMLSINLGLEEGCLQRALGGENNDIEACMRVNFYPKCPQPDLTLGISPHSDPGGLTLLLPDYHVSGLQVRANGSWIAVKPAPHAFIVNIGDQLQVISNAIYKSVEHRAIVNSESERVSLAFFYNPKSNLLVGPAKELITPERPSLYPTMTFDEYRLYVRIRGLEGKSHVESLKSPE